MDRDRVDTQGLQQGQDIAQHLTLYHQRTAVPLHICCGKNQVHRFQRRCQLLFGGVGQ